MSEWRAGLSEYDSEPNGQPYYLMEVPWRVRAGGSEEEIFQTRRNEMSREVAQIEEDTAVLRILESGARIIPAKDASILTVLRQGLCIEASQEYLDSLLARIKTDSARRVAEKMIREHQRGA